MNKFILLIMCIAGVMCYNGYAADVALSPRSAAAIEAAINNHPRVRAAEAYLKAAKAREKPVLDIMTAAVALLHQDINNTTNQNIYIEAQNNWSPLAAAVIEAAKQCTEARRIIAHNMAHPN